MPNDDNQDNRPSQGEARRETRGEHKSGARKGKPGRPYHHAGSGSGGGGGGGQPWRSRERAHKPGPAFNRDRDGDEDDGPIRLFGIHAVDAALRNPQRRIKRLLMTDNAGRRLADALAAHPIAHEAVTPRDLDRLLGEDAVHQGVMLEVEPLPEPELDDLAERATSGTPLVILDQVTDPHNVGAVLRSSAVFGAAGLIMTRRHSPPPNGTLAKSASGALELVPILWVQNLARTLEDLKQRGVVLVGLDGGAGGLIEDEPFDRPTALLLGAEGKGLRQLTRETCNRLVRIDTPGSLASLNVSNAAAVALHMAAMRRRAKPA